MFKLFSRFALLATLAIGLGACSDKSSTPTGAAALGPEQTIQQSVKLARESDVAGLIELMLPPEDFASVKARWGVKMEDTPSAKAGRARVAAIMNRLTAEGAAQTLFGELEPDIRQFDAQYGKQIPGYANMGRSFFSGILRQSQELSESEKQQALDILEQLAPWFKETHFTDPDLVRKALGVLIEYARKLDIKNLDEARAMSFDEAAPKLAIAFDAVKQLLDVYGLSINQTLDSVKTELISSEGDSAVVKVSYTLLGSPLESTSNMIRIDGRWYSKDRIDRLRARNAQRAAATAAPSTSKG
jgi:hypothetical protein